MKRILISALIILTVFSISYADKQHRINIPETPYILRHVYVDDRPTIQWITDPNDFIYADRFLFRDLDEREITAVAAKDHIEIQVSGQVIMTKEATIKGRYYHMEMYGSRTSFASRPNLRSKYLNKPTPPFDITSWYQTKPLTLEALRGKVVLIDFWGVWCPPCVHYLPHNQELYDRFSKQGLEIIAIHSARDGKKMKKFLKKYEYTYNFCVDTGKTAKDYMVKGWPTYYLLDRDGLLVWGPSHSPPTPKDIESLLSKDEESNNHKSKVPLREND